MNTLILESSIADTFSGRITFGEVIARLLQTGVQRYLADLCAASSRHYSADDLAIDSAWPADWTTPPIADQFDEAAVIAAIRASQARQIIFPQVLERIAAAGVTHYTVHFGGRNAIYTGRHGDFYIEPFPPAA